MKTSILTLLLLAGLAACRSNEPQQKVTAMAGSYEPVLEIQSQVDRMKAMIQNDKKLNADRKKQLTALIDEEAARAVKIKKEQSQLRAVLIDQLLKSADGSNSETMTTTKRLENLNKANIKELNDFILKFKSLSGERDIHQDDMMREMATVNLI